MSDNLKPLANATNKFHFEAHEIAEMNPPHKNYALALCAACITHHWKHGFDLEEIILSPATFGLLQKWVERVYGTEAADGEEFYWHAIRIRRAKIVGGGQISWTIKKLKANA